MRLFHSPARMQASFDDRNLLSRAGLVALDIEGSHHKHMSLT